METIVLMVSDYLRVDIKEEDIIFDDILENKNIWSTTIKYKENEKNLILVDNINLFVILINKSEIIILFKGEPSPPPWNVYPKDKKWICTYFRAPRTGVKRRISCEAHGVPSCDTKLVKGGKRERAHGYQAPNFG
jgi:hypothetical protein